MDRNDRLKKAVARMIAQCYHEARESQDNVFRNWLASDSQLCLLAMDCMKFDEYGPNNFTSSYGYR